MSALTPRIRPFLAPPRRFRSALASRDVQADGAWVEVLEVGQGRAVLGTELKRDSMTGRAAECSDGIAVARRYGNSTEVLRYAGRIRVSCCQGGSTAEPGEVDGAAAGEGETGRHELRLLGEEEDQTALLAIVARWDVEVENRRNVRRHFTVKGGAVRFVRHRFGHGHDEMRELILAVEIGGA
jgi:hypothetical protein